MKRSASAAKSLPESFSRQGSEATLMPVGYTAGRVWPPLYPMNMLCLRALRVMAVRQLSRPCWRLNSVSVVPWPNSTGRSSLRPWVICQRGPFFSKNCTMFGVPGTGSEPSGQKPVAAPWTSAWYTAGGRAWVGERRRTEGERPLGADDALRGEAGVEVVPGDLRSERVEDRLAVARSSSKAPRLQTTP